MELYPLKVFLTVAGEKSFSRAAEKLLRTQPAVSLAIQKLESDLQEKLIDRSGKELLLTDAGRIVHDYARRFENLEADLENALAELRDNSAGRLVVGANESTSLYLLGHIERYRRLYPKVKVQIRRSFSSKIPSQLIDGDLELGVISYDPEDDRLLSRVIYTDHLAFVVSPQHRFANREEVSINELGMETFIAHNLDVEMPTVETIRKLVQRNEGVAFLPHMCVEQDVEQDVLREIKVKELRDDRKIRLVCPAKRSLSHAAKAFLELVRGG